MQNYKPNSHKFKDEQKNLPAERKKLEKVTTGKVTVKKKSETAKFAEKIISAEDVGNIKTYLIDDVIIPTIKNTIWDAFTNTLDMVLFGGTGRSKKRSTAEKISYRNFYDKQDDRRRYGMTTKTKVSNAYAMDDISFDSRGEAEEVLTRMEEVLDSYPFVTVADLCDLAGITGNYTDNKYGWTNLRSAEVVRTYKGYKLKLPRAMAID